MPYKQDHPPQHIHITVFKRIPMTWPDNLKGEKK